MNLNKTENIRSIPYGSILIYHHFSVFESSFKHFKFSDVFQLTAPFCSNMSIWAKVLDFDNVLKRLPFSCRFDPGSPKLRFKNKLFFHLIHPVWKRILRWSSGRYKKAWNINPPKPFLTGGVTCFYFCKKGCFWHFFYYAWG